MCPAKCEGGSLSFFLFLKDGISKKIKCGACVWEGRPFQKRILSLPLLKRNIWLYDWRPHHSQGVKRREEMGTPAQQYTGNEAEFRHKTFFENFFLEVVTDRNFFSRSRCRTSCHSLLLQLHNTIHGIPLCLPPPPPRGIFSLPL